MTMRVDIACNDLAAAQGLGTRTGNELAAIVAVHVRNVPNIGVLHCGLGQLCVLGSCCLRVTAPEHGSNPAKAGVEQKDSSIEGVDDELPLMRQRD